MSDVTRRMILRAAGVLAVLSVVVAVTVTLLQPPPAPPAYRPALATRVPGAILPAPAGPVLPGVAADSRAPSAAGLQRALEPLIEAQALGSGVSVDVLDPLTGDHLLSRGPAVPRTPASTAKLLTAAAALSALGPRTRFPTTAVRGARDGQVVLVGGGDVLLAPGAGDRGEVNGHAGLADLAGQTARQVRAGGTRSVRLLLDDRLFSGPTRAPGWSAGDVDDGYVAPVQALAVDAGRLSAGSYAERAGDPAMRAAKTFAGLLEDRGIAVTGSVRRGAAPARAVRLGRVESAPVTALVEYALTESDNTLAEALGRLVALRAGEPGSFSAAGPAVVAEVGRLGVPVEGAYLADTSGLAGGSLVPARTLTGILALAAGDAEPQLRPVLSGLPVAAVSGTLVNRFSAGRDRRARGVVRAKTGTLTGASSLAGTVVDRDGRLLVFAALADGVGSTGAARTALDRLATALAGCGCR